MTTIPVFQYTEIRPNQNGPQPELNSPTLEVGPVRGACLKRYVKLKVKHTDMHSVDVIEVDFDALAQALGFSSFDNHAAFNARLAVQRRGNK